MKIGIISPYPPPRGGVSVHSCRLVDALRDQGIEVNIFDSKAKGDIGGRFSRKLSHFKWLLRFFVCARVDIFHIHISEWRDRAVIIYLARRRKIKTVVTFHSLRDEFGQMTFWQKRYVSYVVNHADHLIAAGENEKNKLVRYFNCEARVTVLPAFIPPKRVDREIPEQLAAFIRKHELIISANASNMDFYQGLDLYGLDMLVELCGRLRTQSKVGFVYCLTRLTDREYWEKIQIEIKELKIEDSFLIVLDSLEFWPVLEKSHIFIRPTCTDSYGVSVAEALSLGVPSIASDVCPRPVGTTLFLSRDSEDLYAKVCEIIRNYDQNKAKVQRLEFESCAPAIQRIYRILHAGV